MYFLARVRVCSDCSVTFGREVIQVDQVSLDIFSEKCSLCKKPLISGMKMAQQYASLLEELTLTASIRSMPERQILGHLKIIQKKAEEFVFVTRMLILYHTPTE